MFYKVGTIFINESGAIIILNTFKNKGLYGISPWVYPIKQKYIDLYISRLSITDLLSDNELKEYILAKVSKA